MILANAGFRTLYILHVKQVLYQLSYIRLDVIIKESIQLILIFHKKSLQKKNRNQ